MNRKTPSHGAALAAAVLFTGLLLISATASAGRDGSRGGKGNGGGCELEFKAWFDPSPTTDSLRGDSNEHYHAEGGTGFRLYTSGGANSERAAIIDFGQHNDCNANSTNPLNPGAAAGFCVADKNIDLRIERQAQVIDADLCDLAPGESFLRTIVVNFESGPIDEGSLVDPDRKGNPNKPQALKLSYGCEAQSVPTSYRDESRRALVTREDDNTWTIVGLEACLMTQTGDVLLDGYGEPVWFDMPFGLLLQRN